MFWRQPKLIFLNIFRKVALASYFEPYPYCSLIRMFIWSRIKHIYYIAKCHPSVFIMENRSHGNALKTISQLLSRNWLMIMFFGKRYLDCLVLYLKDYFAHKSILKQRFINHCCAKTWLCRKSTIKYLNITFRYD